MLLAMAALAATVWFHLRATTTSVIVLRHAEKQLGSIDDPPLSAAGSARAERLAQLFGHRGELGSLEAIYATDTRRAQQTAAPLAARLGVEITTVAAGEEPGAIAKRVLREHRGGAVLVIGHANSVPEITHALLGRREIPPLAEDDYGALYIVTVADLGRSAVLRASY